MMKYAVADIFGILFVAVVVDLISTWQGWRIPWSSTAAVCTLILWSFEAQWGRDTQRELEKIVVKLEVKVDRLQSDLERIQARL